MPRCTSTSQHDEIMPSASLVVGHGGHSTTRRALAHGVPLLIVPIHRILDQPMIGEGRRGRSCRAGLSEDCFRQGLAVAPWRLTDTAQSLFTLPE